MRQQNFIKSIIVAILFCFGLNTSNGFTQTSEFKVPDENAGVLILKAGESDTIIIKEDSAYVLSVKALEMYEGFYEKLQSCYNERDNDILQIKADLQDFRTNLDKILELIDKGDSVSLNTLAQTEKRLGEVLENLTKNVSDLKTIQTAIDEASAELEKIEKQIKKEKTKRFWYKAGDMIVAGAVGFIIGALVL